MYINVYRHVYQPYSCISCFRTYVFRLGPVFSFFEPVYRYFFHFIQCIPLYTAGTQPPFGLSDLETSNSSPVYTSENLCFNLLLADSMNKVLGLCGPIGKCEEKRYESETTRVVSHATQRRELVFNNDVSKSKY
uniref:Putative ovule protein n=1 Tax=Solanum chacoense TaxID=4108 RepID=A0A0V0H1F9_SOLCH